MSDGLSARQRGVLAAAGVANALIVLDQTSVTVALPAIALLLMPDAPRRVDEGRKF